MSQGGRLSVVLDAVIGIFSTILGNFIYDKAKALDWNRIKPLLLKAAIEGAVFVGAAVVALWMILYLPLAP